MFRMGALERCQKLNGASILGGNSPSTGINYGDDREDFCLVTFPVMVWMGPQKSPRKLKI